MAIPQPSIVDPSNGTNTAPTNGSEIKRSSETVAQESDLKPPCHTPQYFDEALADAERMLKYAAEVGIDLDDEIRDHILQARAAADCGKLEQATIRNLLTALTKLAARMKPVTADSLKACNDSAQVTVHNYWWIALCLAVVIVPFS